VVKIGCSISSCAYNSDGVCTSEEITIDENGVCLTYEKDTKQKTRIIGYYDLIELPSGRHIPVPLAIKRVGIKEVLKIPVAKRRRDGEFYFCEKCYEESCLLCDCQLEDEPCWWCDSNPYSFFRCKMHKPVTQSETNSKLAIFEILVKLGYHEFMKYIESAYGSLKGWIEVTPDGEFVGGLFPMGVITSVEDLYR